MQKKIRQAKQKRLPHALADAETRKLLGCITNPIHRTCFAIMYACGLRTSEAATLEIGAIDSRNLLLRIIGKGNKERLVPLPEPMLLSLRRLWKTHKNPRWLFPNRAGDPSDRARYTDSHLFGGACRGRLCGIPPNANAPPRPVSSWSSSEPPRRSIPSDRPIQVPPIKAPTIPANF